MPTCSIPIADNRILLVASVSLPSPHVGTASTFKALVDTGAQRSMVTNRVVASVGAFPIDIESADGSS